MGTSVVAGDEALFRVTNRSPIYRDRQHIEDLQTYQKANSRHRHHRRRLIQEV